MDDTDRDPAFIYEDPIFDREELLHVQHVPSSDRIVGRDGQISKVAQAINPALFGSPPGHLIIYGKTGTGKSLIARHVTQRLAEEAVNENIAVRRVRIDCGRRSTETEAVKTIARQLNTDTTAVSVPEKGLGAGDYYERLWKIVETTADVVFVILDEIDKLKNDEVLRSLSRAGEDDNITDAFIGVIGISNKIDYPDDLSERVKSSFQYDDLVFPPYDATQLREILHKREDAFKQGVLREEVIPLCAGLSAQEHGDARKAIDILRNAGRIARDEQADEVTEAHARAGKEQAELNRFNELLRGTPVQGKAVLLALAQLTENRGTDAHSTKDIYRMYSQITDSIGMDSLSERRVSELLDEQAFLNVTRSTRTSRGRGKGMYSEHRLLEDWDIVKRVIVSDSRFSEEDIGAE